MKIRNATPVLLLLSYLFVSWIKFEQIKNIAVSLFSYIALTVSEFVSPEKYWRNELAELWIAGIVWLLGGLFIAWMLSRKQLRRVAAVHLQPTALTFLVCLSFAALTAPIVAPIDPNLQGDLTSTRLLPPMSKGVIIESHDGEPAAKQAHGVYGLFESAKDRLLQRRLSVFGQSAQASEFVSPHATGRSFYFLLGTDDNGRDVLSRVLFGSRISLLIGLLAAVTSVFLGTVIGFAAGYTNRIVDSLLMRLTDLVLSIPSLFLVVAIMAFLGKSISTLIVVLSLTGWMGTARAVRTEVLRLREREFVLAAKLLNQSPLKIMKNHIFRNLKPMIAVAATLQFANAVLAEASLSFLSLGVQPPTASWGNMLGQSLNYLDRGWWLGFFPGALLALLLISAYYAVEGKASSSSW